MKNLKKIIPMLLMLLFIVVLLPTNLNEVQAAKAKLNSTALSMSKGDTYTLKLKNNKSKIKWSSSNKKIVSVNSSGKLTAKKNGTCKVYAKVGSKKYTCNVTVEGQGSLSGKLTWKKQQKNKLVTKADSGSFIALIPEKGNKIKSAHITKFINLKNNKKIIYSTTADKNGNYKLDNIPSGDYILFIVSKNTNWIFQSAMNNGGLTIYNSFSYFLNKNELKILNKNIKYRSYVILNVNIDKDKNVYVNIDC